MRPIQPPPAASSSPANRKSLRRRPNLPLPLRQRDPSFTVPPASAPSSSSSTQLSAHLNFSKLERLSRIGSGSGSTVYKVLDHHTGRIYALKVIYGIPEDSVRVRREIEILRDVDNPNVIRCHDLIQHNSEIHVLLEYMDKGSLVGIHIPDEPSLSELTRQILSGLHYLHKRNIVHRDIEPSNLLINSKCVVKIADFGVSILNQTTDNCKISVETIAYMSPERINTDLNHNNDNIYVTDTWSLGVCILEFYLGRLPFPVGKEETDWASPMHAICMSEPPKAPPTASMEFRHFISCCLQKHPASRWDAGQLLRHPFIVQYSPPRSAINHNQVEQGTKLPGCRTYTNTGFKDPRRL